MRAKTKRTDKQMSIPKMYDLCICDMSSARMSDELDR